MHSEDDEPLVEGKCVPDGAWDVATAPDALREAVWTRTVSVVRTRRRIRKVLLLCALAAAYVSGVVTPWLIARERSPAAPRQLAASPPAQVIAPNLSDRAKVDSVENLLSDREKLALALASSTVKEQVELLRAVGDRALEEGDTDLALSCYGRLISLGPPPKNEPIDVADTWLLRSLKQARLQEEHHESSQS
ncbi:MAG: hypothetical protein K1Y02_13530 [Candidatus Hydrogenedentes bacterium]|nr:hypothetical protein [Candidatus Hydrogenedentota bacterium]